MSREAQLFLATLALAAVLATAASATAGHGVFYLTVHPRQCLIGSSNGGGSGAKTVLVVPCSNPHHRLEVYAVGHGGWGTPPRPPSRPSSQPCVASA